MLETANLLVKDSQPLDTKSKFWLLPKSKEIIGSTATERAQLLQNPQVQQETIIYESTQPQP